MANRRVQSVRSSFAIITAIIIRLVIVFFTTFAGYNFILQVVRSMNGGSVIIIPPKDADTDHSLFYSPSTNKKNTNTTVKTTMLQNVTTTVASNKNRKDAAVAAELKIITTTDAFVTTNPVAVAENKSAIVGVAVVSLTTNTTPEIITETESSPVPHNKNNNFPLKPPFRIYQLGRRRSGSTFQEALLRAIITVKMNFYGMDTSQVIVGFARNTKLNEELIKKENKNQNQNQTSFLVKAHDERYAVDIVRKYRAIDNNNNATTVHVFTSSSTSSSSSSSSPFTKITSTYHQRLEDLNNCSLCEIQNYIPIFDLQPTEVRFIEAFMSRFEILRRCCGMQQSKYNRYRLHGCNVTELLTDNPEIHYPYCERHNLSQVEHEFSNLPYTQIINSNRFSWSKYIWKQQGDCSKYDAMIRKGADFNLQPHSRFRSCHDFRRKYKLHPYN